MAHAVGHDRFPISSARCRSVVRYRRRGRAAAVVALAVLSMSFGGVDTSASPLQPAADPKVISDWNAIAFDTIVVDAGKANAEAFIWFAFEQAAVYNAVVGITRRYELYKWNARGPRGASPQAAAAVAAHDVLLEYFPASQGRLDTALAASLAKIPDRPKKKQGIHYGERAADRLIELRKDDGRFGPVTFDDPPAPGVWRPTPPAFAPFFDPWLAQLRPLLLDSPSQFRPGPPPAMTTQAYTDDFNEVKEMGSATSRSVHKSRPTPHGSSPGAPSPWSVRRCVTWRPDTTSISARAPAVRGG